MPHQTAYRRVHIERILPSPPPGRFQWLSVDAIPELGQLVTVHYAVDGKPQEYGLRLDLGKGIFLDRPDDPDLREFMESTKDELIHSIASRLRR